jgi:hypothetical protein
VSFCTYLPQIQPLLPKSAHLLEFLRCCDRARAAEFQWSGGRAGETRSAPRASVYLSFASVLVLFVLWERDQVQERNKKLNAVKIYTDTHTA